jgi:hypothetical protein
MGARLVFAVMGSPSVRAVAGNARVGGVFKAIHFRRFAKVGGSLLYIVKQAVDVLADYGIGDGVGIGAHGLHPIPRLVSSAAGHVLSVGGFAFIPVDDFQAVAMIGASVIGRVAGLFLGAVAQRVKVKRAHAMNGVIDAIEGGGFEVGSGHWFGVPCW